MKVAHAVTGGALIAVCMASFWAFGEAHPPGFDYIRDEDDLGFMVLSLDSDARQHGYVGKHFEQLWNEARALLTIDELTKHGIYWALFGAVSGLTWRFVWREAKIADAMAKRMRRQELEATK